MKKYSGKALKFSVTVLLVVIALYAFVIASYQCYRSFQQESDINDIWGDLLLFDDPEVIRSQKKGELICYSSIVAFDDEQWVVVWLYRNTKKTHIPSVLIYTSDRKLYYTYNYVEGLNTVTIKAEVDGIEASSPASYIKDFEKKYATNLNLLERKK